MIETRYPARSESRYATINALGVLDNPNLPASFEIDEFTRHCLLEGLDDIGLTLQHDSEIAAYEARHSPPIA